MKNIFNLLLIISLFIGCSHNHNKKIHDIIQPINLEEGIEKEIVISDLFYAEHYDLTFAPNENLMIVHDSVNHILKLKAKDSFAGLDVIEFTFENQQYQIPFKLQSRKKYHFTYKPKGKPEKVNLFGQFNSWDRNSLPMSDSDGDGIYEISIPLDPGRYEYKFFVDRKELIDLQNPVKVPNGLGDYNSVIIIDSDAEDKMYLHVLNYEAEDQTKRYNYYLEGFHSSLERETDIVALLDNQQINVSLIKVDGNKISILFPDDLIDGERLLRVAVRSEGRFSNIQSTRIIDGRPVNNDSPQTWYDAIIYSLMIDRFNNGDPSNDNPVNHDSLFTPANYNGGDLQGIINKISEGYFDQLGINTFWISPIVDNTNKAYREYPPPHRYYTGYHGYWPISLEGVEEHFGDMNLATELISKAHNNDIKVLLDFVANHIHEEHPLWKENRDWFGVLELPDGRKNLRLWDEYRLTTWFEPYMPSFDYVGSKVALETMTDNAVWWLKETKADGFRHDAVKHVPNEFWRLLTKKIKERIEIPNQTKVYQIGETFGGYDLISSYVSNGQLNSQFNFNLYDTAIPVFLDGENSFELLDLQMQKTFQVYGVNHLMGNLVSSHDKIRYMAYADGDLEINDGKANEIAWTNPPKVDNTSSYDKLKLHLAYILTIPGVPVIYYGDEIGMTGASDPDNRRMMRFDNDLNEYEKQMFKDVSKLIRSRGDHSALRHGDFLTLQADKNIYAYLRSDMNERILVILNKSEKEQQVNLTLPSIYNLGRAEDLISAEPVQLNNNLLSVNAKGIGYRIIKLN
ncbi:MAG: alpha-glucosidase C-terminal domain-containing protein [Ignavibacteriaceae bacterium]|nr:alpha-glucosidase C-terminal domain-containing protein [Ignavibacteriaceae bacterium]